MSEPDAPSIARGPGDVAAGLSEREIDLDPADWETFRADAHRALDDMIANVRSVRERPVWQPTPPAVRARFEAQIPHDGRPLSDVLTDFDRNIAPYVVGNRHPLFMGWVHGAGTPVGMVAEMLAAGLNANCGGRNHVAINVERQIAAWVAQAFGFPQNASGIFVTGASTGNFLSVIVARHRAAKAIREDGVAAQAGTLVAYTSVEAHQCVARAIDLAGLGVDNLRLIATDHRRRIDIEALADSIQRDRAEGLTPFLVVGTAGTVNTGAFDDLDRLASLASQEGLWFHVDGAFGALAAFSPELRRLVKGLERADSVAFDFHKWFHVPYDAGFFLVRDPDIHRSAFAGQAVYLSRATRGLAAGSDWPCDLGIDLSRGFRALKTWFTIEVFGIDRLVSVLENTCVLARHLQVLIERSQHFEMRAPVDLNIVCFGVRNDPTGERTRNLVMGLHESGMAAPSLTALDGIPAIRAAIVNHRTRSSDIEGFARTLEAALEKNDGSVRSATDSA